jgi:hypothetical protein
VQAKPEVSTWEGDSSCAEIEEILSQETLLSLPEICFVQQVTLMVVVERTEYLQ